MRLGKPGRFCFQAAIAKTSDNISPKCKPLSCQNARGEIAQNVQVFKAKARIWLSASTLAIGWTNPIYRPNLEGSIIRSYERFVAGRHSRRMIPVAGIAHEAGSAGTAAVAGIRSTAGARPWQVRVILADPPATVAFLAYGHGSFSHLQPVRVKIG